jgi:hypothetical protein
MTASLSLVSSNINTPAPAIPAPTQPDKYTPAEDATIKGYQDALGAGRYFKLYDASSPFPRLIAASNSTAPLPLSFLSSDFKDWCDETGNRCPAKMPTDAYLARPLLTVTGTIFLPNGSALVRAKHSRHRYVNTFRKFEPQHPAISLSPDFLELLACLFPDPAERHTFIQYCTHMFRFPEIRPSWHPMLLSETGTGKGFIFNDILSPLLCMQTVLIKKYAELTGRFANAMEGTLLVQLDDCKTKRDDVQTQLKSLMSEERILLEKKSIQAGMVATYTRFFLASNELVPLDIDDTDRRWWIPKRMGYSNGLLEDEGRKDRKNLIQRISDWLKKDGALESVYAFFWDYDLKDFDPKSAPDTETRREQIAKSVTVEQGFALNFLTNHATQIIKSEELSKAFQEAGMSKPGNRPLSNLFTTCGYQAGTLKAKNIRLRWWFPIAMSKADAEAVLEALPAF